MLRLLPFILIPALVFAALFYWRYWASSKINLTTSKTETENAIEVPATLPGASLEDRVKTLEETLIKLVAQVNTLKSSKESTQTTSGDSELSTLEGSITELKARVSSLEKTNTQSTTTTSTSKSVVYIPLGSGGKWGDKDWYTASEYEVSLNPDNYPGYTGMVLEANFKLAENSGTGSIRLYNVTDGSAIASQIDTTSNSYTLKSSSSFTLPSGTKTYKLQVKSTQGADLYIQSARIKVNF